MTDKIKDYLKENHMLSQYGRDLISQNKTEKKTFFTTKKQTMVSKEEVLSLIHI